MVAVLPGEFVIQQRTADPQDEIISHIIFSPKEESGISGGNFETDELAQTFILEVLRIIKK